MPHDSFSAKLDAAISLVRNDADFEVIESRQWKNSKTGQTASIYGSVPYTSAEDKPNWKIETVGWTVRNNRTGSVGIGRLPWKSKSEAEAWVAKQVRK